MANCGKRCFPPLIYAPILTAASHRGRRLSLPENVPCISDFARARLFEFGEEIFCSASARNAGRAGCLIQRNIEAPDLLKFWQIDSKNQISLTHR